MGPFVSSRAARTALIADHRPDGDYHGLLRIGRPGQNRTRHSVRPRLQLKQMTQRSAAALRERLRQHQDRMSEESRLPTIEPRPSPNRVREPRKKGTRASRVSIMQSIVGIDKSPADRSKEVTK